MNTYLFRRTRTIEQVHLFSVSAESYEEAISSLNKDAKKASLRQVSEEVIQEDFEFITDTEE